MLKLLSAAAATGFLMLGIHYHDHVINRTHEMLFFGGSVASAMFFEWLLHRKGA